MDRAREIYCKAGEQSENTYIDLIAQTAFYSNSRLRIVMAQETM